MLTKYKKDIANNIAEVIEKQLNIEKDILFNSCRKAEYCRIREMYIVLLRQKGFTYQEIGKLMNRNHASIMNAFFNFVRNKKDYPEYDKIYDIVFEKKLFEKKKKIITVIENILYDYYECYLNEQIINKVTLNLTNELLKI